MRILNQDLPRQPFQNIKEPRKMANPVHTGPGSTERGMHTLLECLVVKQVVGLSKAVIGDDIDSKSRVSAAHNHRLSRFPMSLQSVGKLIDGVHNQRFQPPH